MKAGVLYLTVANVVSKLLKIIVHVVLAWLLFESDYGLVAMTMAIMMVFQMLSEFGIGVTVVQKANMNDDFPAAAFWLNLGLSVLMAAVACALAPPLATFYGDDRIVLLVQVSAIGFIITALRTIPMALIRKRLEFGRYAALDSSWHILTGVLAIVFAVLGAGYWSLIIPNMASALLLTPLWFWAARWIPSFKFRFSIAAEVFAYSKYVVGVSLFLVVLSNAGFLVAGRVLQDGGVSAGLYKMAMDNGMLVVINFAWLVGNVTMSGFALHQDDPQKLRRAFGQVLEVLAAVTLPVHCVLLVMAPAIFDTVFPDRWEPARPLFQVLLLYAMVRALVAHVAPFYNATKRARTSFVYYGAVTFIAVPIMYWACIQHGMTGLAWATVATQGAGGIVLLALTPHFMKWDSLGYMRLLAPYAVGSAVAAGLAYGVNAAGTALEWHPAIICAAGLSLGLGAYPVVLYLIARKRLATLCQQAMPPSLQRMMARFVPSLVTPS
jgi:PST family polysaccharide transporter